MKKSIVLASTIALSTIIAVSASADTINGVQVVSNDGHTITLANGQVARIDNHKVYMDGIGEVILAPDVKPVEIPNQQTPTQIKSPDAPIQGVPTKQQQTPTPVVSNPPVQQTPTKSPNTPVVPQSPKTPATPNQQTPTKTPNTPAVNNVDPKVSTHNSVATPTKTPNTPVIPGTLVENVPVKTFPQKNDNTPLPTQTIDTHTTTVEKETVKPIVVPKDINKGVATVKTTKVESKISPVVKTAKTVAPVQVIKAQPSTVKVPAKAVSIGKPVSTPIVKTAKATLPVTGDNDKLEHVIALAGVVVLGAALSTAVISYKRKHN